GVEKRMNIRKLGLHFTDDNDFIDSGANGRKQIFNVHGFGEEIKRATFHRLHTVRNITLAGEKNNRQDTAFLVQCRLELKAIETRHREVKHKAPRHGWIVLRKKFRG